MVSGIVGDYCIEERAEKNYRLGPFLIWVGVALAVAAIAIPGLNLLAAALIGLAGIILFASGICLWRHKSPPLPVKISLIPILPSELATPEEIAESEGSCRAFLEGNNAYAEHLKHRPVLSRHKVFGERLASAVQSKSKEQVEEIFQTISGWSGSSKEIAREAFKAEIWDEGLQEDLWARCVNDALKNGTLLTFLADEVAG